MDGHLLLSWVIKWFILDQVFMTKVTGKDYWRSSYLWWLNTSIGISTQQKWPTILYDFSQDVLRIFSLSQKDYSLDVKTHALIFHDSGGRRATFLFWGKIPNQTLHLQRYQMKQKTGGMEWLIFFSWTGAGDQATLQTWMLCYLKSAIRFCNYVIFKYYQLL